jgi:hypothetical protein
MKKLEDLFDRKLNSIEANEMHSLFGGAEKPTQLQDGATLRRYGGGCSQADVNKNDKQTLVGDVICIKDTTVVTSPIGTLDDSNTALDSIVDSALIQ